MLVVALGVCASRSWGIRRRHGGLGGWGRAAFWLFVASPFIAAPFAWGAGYAFAAVQLVVLTLLGIGMIRARILPVPAVALFTLAPPCTVVAVVLSGEDAAAYAAIAGAAASALGLMWVGWAMWREPALDVRGDAAKHTAGACLTRAE